VTFGGGFTRTCPLTAREWGRTAALGALALPAGLVMRVMPQPFQDDGDEGGGGGGGRCFEEEGGGAVTAAEAATAVAAAAAKVTAVAASGHAARKDAWGWASAFALAAAPAWVLVAVLVAATR